MRLNQTIIASDGRTGRVIGYGILPGWLWVLLEDGRRVLTHEANWRAL